jgi:nucleoside-diphosphate-sugar epimerase
MRLLLAGAASLAYIHAHACMEGQSMRLLIAGAGYVGSALATRMASESHEVFALRRSPTSIPGVQTIAADLTSPDLALPAVDAVVYLVGAGGRTEEAYRAAYVDGLRNVIERTRPARLLFTSSTAVYGQREGEWVTETSATEPSAKTARILLEGEALARAHGTVVRLSGIYGPGRVRLVSNVHLGKADESPDEAYGNRIHRDDCAGLLAHLLGLASIPDVVCGVDDAPVPLGEVRDFVAARLGVTRTKSAAKSEQGKRISNARMHALGYTLAYPSYREGYPAIVDEYLATLTQ